MQKHNARKLFTASMLMLACAGTAMAASPTVLNLFSDSGRTTPLTGATMSHVRGATDTTEGKDQFTVYVQGGTSGSPVQNLYFWVDLATLPTWLTATNMAATTDNSGEASIVLVTSSVANSLPPGIYSGTVRLSATGYNDQTLPVTMTINNVPSTLTARDKSITWSIGDPAPTVTVMVTSNDQPVNFTCGLGSVNTQDSTTADKILNKGGVALPAGPPYAWTAAVGSGNCSGLAYSWGTPVVVSVAQFIANNAAVADVYDGYLDVTYGSPATTVRSHITITVTPPTPVVSSVWPAQLASGIATANVVLTGRNFVAPPTVTRTQVQVSNSGIATGTGSAASPVTIGSGAGTGAIEVVNTGSISLTLPSTVLTAAGTLTFKVLNPLTGANVAPWTGALNTTTTLPVVSSPLIYAVTNAASFKVLSTPIVAPYEVISIFGSNFYPHPGSGATATPATVVGAPDANNFYAFPKTLTVPYTTPAALNPAVKVTFYKVDGTTSIGDAPILFATPTQINAVVPASVASTIAAVTATCSINGTPTTPCPTLKIKVTSLSAANPAVATASPAFAVNYKPMDPGIFSTDSTGQGAAAALLADYSANSDLNPAWESTSADPLATASTKNVLIYLTGVGIPDSTGTNVLNASPAWSAAGCVSPANYMSTINAAITALPAPAPGAPAKPSAWTTIDGAVILSSRLATGMFAPCLANAAATAVSATIGGQTATVTYAGFVADSVAGLYQVNLTVPAGASGAAAGTANQVPVVITFGTGTTYPTQANVSLWVNK